MSRPVATPPGPVPPVDLVVAPAKATLRGRITPVHRATAGSVLTGLIGQVNLLASGVLAARMLGPENRGHLALLILIPLALSFVGSLGLPLATTYFIARTPANARATIHSVLRMAGLQAVVLLAVHAAVLVVLYRNAADDVRLAALFSLGVVPAAIMHHYGVAILQGRRRFTAVNVCRLLPSVLWVVAVVSVFTAGGDDLAMLGLLWTAGYLVAGVVGLGTALRRLPAADSSAEAPGLATMTRFGTRAFLGSASPVEMFSVDQAVVGLFVSPAALGLYVVATAFTNLPRFLAQSIGLVAYPTIAALPDRRAMRTSLWRFFLVTLALSAASVVALEILVGTLVPFFYGDEFLGAVPLTRILLVAAVFIACRRVLADGARGCGRPVLGSVAEAASWLSLLVLLPVLVPLLGANGVALAVVASSATSFLLLAVGLAMSPDRAGPRSHPARLTTVGWLSIAILAGAVVPFLSPTVAAFATFSLAAAGLAVAARRHLRRPLRTQSWRIDGGESLVDLSPGSSHRFRVARGLYYAGLLLMGQIVLRPVAGLSISDGLFLAAFLAVWAETICGRRSTVPRIRPRSLVLGTVLFAVGVVVSSAPLESPGPSLSHGLRFVYLTLAWFWVGSVVLRNHRQVACAVSLWVASVAVSGLAAVAQLFLGDVIPGTSPVYGRMTGTAFHMNDLGGMAAIALPLAIVLFSRPAGSLWSRRIALVLVSLVGAGLVLSGSVGGLLAAAVGGAVYGTASRVRGRSVVTALVVLGGGFLLVGAQGDAGSPRPQERASQVVGTGNDGTATLWVRIDTNAAALKEIAQNPVVGRGLGQPAATGYQVHNVVLGPWYEGGLFAMLGMIVILVGVARAGLEALRSARSRTEWQLAIGLLAAFSAFLGFAMGAPVLFQRYGWAAAALLIALRCQQDRTAPKLAPSEEPEAAPVTAGTRR